MNRIIFRILIFLMSISLIGIIIVQLYLITTSLTSNEEQFKHHVKNTINDATDNIKQQETYSILTQYNILKDSMGKNPETKDLLDFVLVQKNRRTNETIVYSNKIASQDYGVNLSVFDKKRDSLQTVKNITSVRKTEIFSGNFIDNSSISNTSKPDVTVRKSGNIEILDKAQFEIFFKDIVENRPLLERISQEKLKEILKNEFNKTGIKTPFEFAVYNDGAPTSLQSGGFEFDKKEVFSAPIFADNDGYSKYQLLVTFPEKTKFLFSDLVGITTLSILFTLIILITYTSALNQLIKQRQISQIKTDFINNMTHEFKTPIATINLALDAIQNPKVIEDKEKSQNYLRMIREENKRMHSQVENVLRISKLEKRELEIKKENANINDVIEEAISHINLIIASRNGNLAKKFEAKRSTVYLNKVHFTNVIVNILDNAIKYSPEAPIIEVETTNVKDFILIKVKDNGIGMGKNAQKRIFEKFYREHTGDIHNVKGHGLGLAYVKSIVDDHNGQISVESEKGKGSQFIIKLPLIN
jgi:two-component system, OmpR family, phosphate regulon sensor histidine kinase PhoR